MNYEIVIWYGDKKKSVFCSYWKDLRGARSNRAPKRKEPVKVDS